MIKATGILEDKGKLKDNTRKLNLYLQEIVAEDELEIIKNHGKIGWFVFSPTGIKEDDIPDEPIEFKGDKSPSQRLRATLYVYWQENTDKSKPFDEFYKSYVEKIIDKIKEKLP